VRRATAQCQTFLLQTAHDTHARTGQRPGHEELQNAITRASAHKHARTQARTRACPHTHRHTRTYTHTCALRSAQCCHPHPCSSGALETFSLPPAPKGTVRLLGLKPPLSAENPTAGTSTVLGILRAFRFIHHEFYAQLLWLLGCGLLEAAETSSFLLHKSCNACFRCFSGLAV